MNSLETAAVYIGVNILILVYLAMRVVMRRLSVQVSVGTGGDGDLELRTRVHGNATEYIPAFSVGLYVVAAMGIPSLWIHIFGASFTFGRLLHAFGLAKTVLPARQFGMVLTWLAMLLVAAALIYHALV